jgi:HSF-type DNA-binding
MYFPNTRMSSFQCKLNGYSFRRVTEGRDKGNYYHKLFLKSQKRLVWRRYSASVRANEDLEGVVRPYQQARSIVGSGIENGAMISHSLAPGIRMSHLSRVLTNAALPLQLKQSNSNSSALEATASTNVDLCHLIS